MLIDKVKHLEGNDFVFGTLKYQVTGLKEVSGRIVIKTDRKTFSFYPSEIEDWLDNINIVKRVDEKEAANEALYARTVGSEVVAIANPVKKKVESDNSVISAVIKESSIITQNVSNKMYEMFETLAGKPDDEDYKKAVAMVNLSNAIIGAQLTQLKFHALKNK